MKNLNKNLIDYWVWFQSSSEPTDRKPMGSDNGYQCIAYAGKYSPLVFFHPFSPSLSVGEFKTGWIKMSQFISLLTLYSYCIMGDFKTYGQSCLQV